MEDSIATECVIGLQFYFLHRYWSYGANFYQQILFSEVSLLWSLNFVNMIMLQRRRSSGAYSFWRLSSTKVLLLRSKHSSQKKMNQSPSFIVYI